MYQVPQFTEAESKIVGPLTLRQFLIIAGAGGIGVILYFLMQVQFFIITMIFVAAAAAALAFIKINGQSFASFSLNLSSYYWRPRVYLWKKEIPKVAVQRTTETPQIFSLLLGKPGESPLRSLFLKLQTGDSTLKPRLKSAAVELPAGVEVIRKITGERELAKRVDFRE